MGGVYLVRINHIWKIPGFLDSFIQFKSQLLQVSPKDSVTEILFNFHEKMRKRRGGGGFLTLQIHVTGHTAGAKHEVTLPILFFIVSTLQFQVTGSSRSRRSSCLSRYAMSEVFGVGEGLVVECNSSTLDQARRFL